MKLLFPIFFMICLRSLVRTHSESSKLFETFLESKTMDSSLGFIPLTLDKYQENSNQIDLKSAEIMKSMLETTSLIVENHIFYILDKTSRTNYIEQMATFIEKMKAILVKMKSIQDVLSNKIHANNSLEKVLEEKYNQILSRSHEDTEPAELHIALMQLFFPELQKDSPPVLQPSASPQETLERKENVELSKTIKSSKSEQSSFSSFLPKKSQAHDFLASENNKTAESEKPEPIRKNSKYFYESQKRSNFFSDSDEDFLSHKLSISSPLGHHDVFINHQSINYDDNLKLLQFKSSSDSPGFPPEQTPLFQQKKSLRELFKKFEAIKSEHPLDNLIED